MNLVEGTRLRGSAHRQHFGEYAMGSALECAACLDIAFEKGDRRKFLDTAEASAAKSAAYLDLSCESGE